MHAPGYIWSVLFDIRRVHIFTERHSQNSTTHTPFQQSVWKVSLFIPRALWLPLDPYPMAFRLRVRSWVVLVICGHIPLLPGYHRCNWCFIYGSQCLVISTLSMAHVLVQLEQRRYREGLPPPMKRGASKVGHNRSHPPPTRNVEVPIYFWLKTKQTVFKTILCPRGSSGHFQIDFPLL